MVRTMDGNQSGAMVLEVARTSATFSGYNVVLCLFHMFLKCHTTISRPKYSTENEPN